MGQREMAHAQFLIFVSYLLLSRFASAADIKGVEIGMTYDQFDHAMPYASCDKRPDPSECVWDTTLGGTKAYLTINFDAGKVALILATGIDASDFDDLASALRSKFGKPASISGGVVQNGFGARFDQRILVWRGKGWQLSAKKRAGSVFESSVILISPAYAARFPTRSPKDDL